MPFPFPSNGRAHLNQTHADRDTDAESGTVSIPFKRESASQQGNEYESFAEWARIMFPFPSNGIARLNFFGKTRR